MQKNKRPFKQNPCYQMPGSLEVFLKRNSTTVIAQELMICSVFSSTQNVLGTRPCGYRGALDACPSFSQGSLGYRSCIRKHRGPASVLGSLVQCRCVHGGKDVGLELTSEFQFQLCCCSYNRKWLSSLTSGAPGSYLRNESSKTNTQYEELSTIDVNCLAAQGLAAGTLILVHIEFS